MNPIREFSIAYDGSIKLCCNIYFNAPDYGNIMDKSILDYYFDSDLVGFRRNLITFGEKVESCFSCNTGVDGVNFNSESQGYKKLIKRIGLA